MCFDVGMSTLCLKKLKLINLKNKNKEEDDEEEES